MIYLQLEGNRWIVNNKYYIIGSYDDSYDVYDKNTYDEAEENGTEDDLEPVWSVVKDFESVLVWCWNS